MKKKILLKIVVPLLFLVIGTGNWSLFAQGSNRSYTFDLLIRLKVNDRYQTFGVNSKDFSYLATFMSDDPTNNKIIITDYDRWVKHSGILNLKTNDPDAAFTAKMLETSQFSIADKRKLLVEQERKVHVSIDLFNSYSKIYEVNSNQTRKKLLGTHDWSINNQMNEYKESAVVITHLQERGYEELAKNFQRIIQMDAALDNRNVDAKYSFLYATPIDVTIKIPRGVSKNKIARKY